MTFEEIENRVRVWINAAADEIVSRGLAGDAIMDLIKQEVIGAAKKKTYECPQLSAIEWGEIDKAIRRVIEKAFRLDDVRLGSIDLDNQGNVTIWFDEKSPHPLE